MVRRFLYVIAVLVVLFIAGRIALAFWYRDLAEFAFIPTAEYSAPAPLPTQGYGDLSLWVSHPRLGKGTPAQWQPSGTVAITAVPVHAAVFFVQPTSYLSRVSWNADISDRPSRELGDRNVRLLASPFASASELYVPRYRQATFGAFLTSNPDAQRALDLAFSDVGNAFTQFLAETSPDLPIVVAGDSQGSYLLRRLIQQRIAGTPLAKRVAAAYIIGWPVSLKHDLPLMQMPPCTKPDQAACVVSWMSFADPAEPLEMVRTGKRVAGLDGQRLESGDLVCTNPLTGKQGGEAPAESGLGTLKPDLAFADGTIVPQLTSARCTQEGWLSIGSAPEIGPLVLPGNNYHVYDIPLFWMNLRADFARRVEAWHKTQ